MKKTNIILLSIAIFVIGYIAYFTLTTEWHPGPDSMQYNGIEGTQVIAKCLEFKDDTCGLFECMVDECWCDDSSPDLPFVFNTQTPFNDEDGAIDAVKTYIAQLKYDEGTTIEIEDPENLKVIRAVKLNNIFYNVFVDYNGDEIVYTVAVDGIIMKTICGV
jgi:hypothetical protein